VWLEQYSQVPQSELTLQSTVSSHPWLLSHCCPVGHETDTQVLLSHFWHELHDELLVQQLLMSEC